MKTNKLIGIIAGTVSFFILPALALAAGSASIAGLLPGDTVGVGTPVSFSVVPSGFTNPVYQIVDSFGGGVNTGNINSYGVLSWTPNNSDIGTHTITVTVSDSLGDTATAAQTITVVTAAATITNLLPSATVRYGNTLTFSISATGFNNPQYSVADSFGYSTVSLADTDSYGNFHWTPLYQDIGTHTLVATVRNYQGDLATVSQPITVTGPLLVALGPISPAQTVHVGDAVSFTATTTGFTSPLFAVSDAFTSSLGTSTLAVDANGKVTWTPNSNDVGAHIITVSVSDAAGDTGSVQTTIQVNPASATPYVPTVIASVPVPIATSSTVASLTQPSATLYVFKNLLTVGSTGSDVTALQNLLATLGFFAVTPTGYFGQITKAAVQKYQASHGIDTVGYTGPLTRASLNTGK